MRRYWLGGLAAAVSAAVVSWVVWATPPADATPAPYIKVEQVQVDGLWYNCVRIYSSGIDCDWEHPLIGPLDTATTGGPR